MAMNPSVLCVSELQRFGWDEEDAAIFGLVSIVHHDIGILFWDVFHTGLCE